MKTSRARFPLLVAFVLASAIFLFTGVACQPDGDIWILAPAAQPPQATAEIAAGALDDPAPPAIWETAFATNVE